MKCRPSWATKLEGLYLYDNQFTGALPSELTALTLLRRFWVRNNTSLCRPGDSAFTDWLNGIDDTDALNLPTCEPPPPTKPDPPTGLEVETDADTPAKTIELSFDEVSDAVAANTQYRVKGREGASWTGWATLAEVTTSEGKVSGRTGELAIGRAYEVQVRACGDTQSDEACSDASASAFGATASASPTGVSAGPTSPASTSALVLSWTLEGAADHHDAAYNIGYSADTTDTAPAATLDADDVPAFTESEAEVSGLDADTEYRLFVRTHVSRDGETYYTSPWTSATARTEPEAPTKPAQPTGLEAETDADTPAKTMELSFSEASDAVAANTQYRVRGREEGASWTAWATLAEVTTSDGTVSGRTGEHTIGKAYEVQVRACGDTQSDEACSDASASAFGATASANPTEVSAGPTSPASTSALVLSWTLEGAADHHDAAYDIGYSADTTDTAPATTLDGADVPAFTESEAEVSGLDADTEYRLFVRTHVSWDGETHYTSAWTSATARTEPEETDPPPPSSSDRGTLAELYSSTGGSSWNNRTNWLDSTAVLNNWYGVTADESDVVSKLWLGTNNLQGSVPGSLGNLAGLDTLNLGDNGLTGSLPAELGNLPNLVCMSFWNNELTGEIPATLGSLSEVVHLSMSANDLSGEIPAELGNLTKLEGLYLYDNQLTGALPSELTGLTVLRRFLVRDNTSLCRPDTNAFTAWLNGIDDTDALNLPTCELPPPTKPDQPTGLETGTDVDTPAKTIELSFTDASDAVAANTQYRVRGREENASWTAWATLSGVTTSGGKVNGRTGEHAIGKAYEVQVRACGDTQSDEACSDASSSAFGATASASPTGVSARAASPASDTALQLSWTLEGAADHHDAAYDIGYSADTAATVPAATLDTANVPALTDSTAEVSGLDADTEYRLFIRTRVSWDGNNYYTSAWASATARTEPEPPTKPAQPTGLETETDADTPAKTMELSFAEASDAVAANTQYRVRGREENASWTTWATVAEVTTSDGKVSGRTGEHATGKAYEVQVRACGDTQSDQACSDASASAYGATASASPSGVSAGPTSPASTSALVLSWTIEGAADHHDAAYDIGYSADTTDTSPTATLDTTDVPAFADSTAQVTGLGADTDYRLFIRTRISWNGDSYYTSPWASATARTEVETTEPPPSSDRTTLAEFHNAANGNDWTTSTNWLDSTAALNDWYGVTADESDVVSKLWLGSNNLWGSVQGSLSGLAGLDTLNLGDNRLTGPLPSGLGNLSSLVYMSFWNNLLTGEIPAAFGSLSELIHLSMSANDLSGEIPAELGNLTKLEGLYLYDNQLTGALPSELTALSALRSFVVRDNTSLCRPDTPAFTAWLQSLDNTDALDLPACTPNELEPDRDALTALYDAADGSNWTTSTNWLDTASALGDWHGVTADSLNRVRGVGLANNNLKGKLPDKINKLTMMDSLDLSGNQLGGRIPYALSDLTQLQVLNLSNNRFEKRTPYDIRRLTSLRVFNLSNNRLDGDLWARIGEITPLEVLDVSGNGFGGILPEKLAELTNLRVMALSDNNFRRVIPAVLGTMSGLERLELDRNELSGRIPPELGNMSALTTLQLSHNHLTGDIPPELGNLSALRTLTLSNNQLSGALPTALSGLDSLTHLSVADNLALCRPDDASLTTWLEELADTDALELALCTEPDTLVVKIESAHMTQAVQKWDQSVRLLAGRAGALRVFAVADHSTSAVRPPVRATFYREGQAVYTATDTALAFPTDLSEDEPYDFESLPPPDPTINIPVPDSVIKAGLEVVVEIDPDSTITWGDESKLRFPETGRLALTVQDVPIFRQMIVPTLPVADPDSSVIDWANALTPDHPDMLDVRTMLPVGEMSIEVHAPFWTSADLTTRAGWRSWLSEIRTLSILEKGGLKYYLGAVSPEIPNPKFGGMGYYGWRASVALAHHLIIAHEYGHNMDLRHAPGCGSGGRRLPDNHPEGEIGLWGYDALNGSFVSPAFHDLMSYCRPNWVNPHHYEKALGWRLERDQPSSSAAASSGRGLLVWGWVAEGEVHLEPAFEVDAPVSLPAGSGSFRLEGINAGGQRAFAYNFDLDEIVADPKPEPDGAPPIIPAGGMPQGGGTFAFVLPMAPTELTGLSQLTVAGPAGAAQMAAESRPPMALVTDPATGQVLAILRDWNGALPPGIRSDAVVSVSRGIPGR